MPDEDTILVAKCKILYIEIIDPASSFNRDRKAYLARHGVDMTRGFLFTKPDVRDGSITIFQKKEE